MFVDIIKSIFLGGVEGITEFLPISSTGHLILLNQWISFSASFTKTFDIVIQLGAILAVIFYFWEKIWPFNKSGEQKTAVLNIWYKTIVGVIPAILIGGILGGYIQKHFFNPWVVAGALVIGGLILIYVEKKHLGHRYETVASIPIMTVFSIGLIQCLSMIPGTSRSAATIIGAIILGASRTAAVEFSFYLAIPTMIAASAYSLLKGGLAMSGGEVVLLIIGFITAFFVALFVIRFFMRYIQSHDFLPFAYYRIILGMIVIVYFWAVR